MIMGIIPCIIKNYQYTTNRAIAQFYCYTTTIMSTGVVKFFNVEKGFGFIVQDDGSNDLFFHHSQVQGDQLMEGDRVQYSVGEGRKGPQAEEVSKIDA